MLADPTRDRVLAALLAMQRHSWDQGVTAAALLESGHHVVLRVLLDDAVARQRNDGRLAELQDIALVNSGALGDVLHDQAQAEQNATWATASQRQRDWLVEHAPRAADGTLFHLADRREIWVDSVYMVVPALAAYGDQTAAVRQLEGHRTRLQNSATGLWRHRWDEDAGRVLDERAWGTGNGWVVTALARAIPRMPNAASDLAELARGTLDACLRCRRADGSFGNHLDDPTSFRETTVASMLAYAALRGATEGWLAERYGQIGAALLESVVAEIDEGGRVQNACGAPDYVRPGFSPESQAFALLADAAHRRWCDR